LNKGSIFEILDGPPKSKHSHMLEIILQSVIKKKWKIVATSQTIDVFIQKIWNDILDCDLQQSFKVMFVKMDGQYMCLSKEGSAPAMQGESGKFKKLSGQELSGILKNTDLLMVHPRFLGEPQFLDYISSSDGFDLALVTKPHEYTDPMLSLALSCSKRCLFSLNSVTTPLPKIRNPYDRNFRYMHAEKFSKVQALASFYTFEKNTRLDEVEDGSLLSLKQERFLSERKSAKIGKDWNPTLQMKPHYVDCRKFLKVKQTEPKMSSLEKLCAKTKQLKIQEVNRYDLNTTNGRNKFIYSGYQDSKGQRKVLYDFEE